MTATGMRAPARVRPVKFDWKCCGGPARMLAHRTDGHIDGPGNPTTSSRLPHLNPEIQKVSAGNSQGYFQAQSYTMGDAAGCLTHICLQLYACMPDLHSSAQSRLSTFWTP